MLDFGKDPWDFGNLFSFLFFFFSLSLSLCFGLAHNMTTNRTLKTACGTCPRPRQVQLDCPFNSCSISGWVPLKPAPFGGSKKGRWRSFCGFLGHRGHVARGTLRYGADEAKAEAAPRLSRAARVARWRERLPLLEEDPRELLGTNVLQISMEPRTPAVLFGDLLLHPKIVNKLYYFFCFSLGGGGVHVCFFGRSVNVSLNRGYEFQQAACGVADLTRPEGLDILHAQENSRSPWTGLVNLKPGQSGAQCS